MCPIIYLLSAVVTIGFNSVTYSVLEDAGSVNITVSIMNGTLARNVVVTLSTVSDGTATGKFNKPSSCTLVKNSSMFLSYLSSWDTLHSCNHHLNV